MEQKMREHYIELMEITLSAYSDEHIRRYFDDVKRDGLKEHGFPRLTADIGILIAHGRRIDLLPIFLEMMEFCCKTIPVVKAANDFSVREIVCCLTEVEASGIASKEDTERWRAYFAEIDPYKTYNCYVTDINSGARNWALFTGTSEFFRREAGIGDTTDFMELQFLQQLKWFDENGMYKDEPTHEDRQPIMYDIVPRVLYSLIMDRGYNGPSRDKIDENLRKAGLCTLEMQSPCGDMAFGGRSNQFVHNEAWLAAIFEYEAKRYKREGNDALASRFKGAAKRAVDVIDGWLSKTPIRHIKNRYPTETGYGCENYAYFDKYMITVASNLYAAYLMCDDSIEPNAEYDCSPAVFRTTDYFGKLFLKSGGYGIEIELNGDITYDANGLGRVHLKDAPTNICMSCPCPQKPNYKIDIEPMAFSLCSAVQSDGAWNFGAEDGNVYGVIDCGTDSNKANATLACNFACGATTTESYSVDKNGVAISVSGEGSVGYALPAFCFDGEISPEIVADKNALTISYEGWTCRYTTDGEIVDTGKTAANRSGHYRAFIATAQNGLNVRIEIIKL